MLFVTTGAFLGTLYLVALFFQDGLGLSALQSGLNTFPEALGVMIGSQVITRLLYPRLGPRRIMTGAGMSVAVIMVLLSFVGTGTNLWIVRTLMLLLGLFQSGVFIPSQAASFATVSPARTGRASTLFNAQRQLGGAVGVAVLTTVVTAVKPIHQVASRAVPHLAAYHAGFLVAAAFAFAAGLFALTVSDADAANTIVARRRKSPLVSSAAAPARP
jgi:sugar phosphate permease